MTLQLHPSFAPYVASLRDRLPHALLLSGPLGAGLGTIAKNIADGSTLTLSPVDKDGKPSPSGSIATQHIRQLYDDTRSVHARMVVIIDDADTLTPAAQGAFLKLLEEPTSHTHFILTSHHPEKLLRTIRSRVQEYRVPPITPEQTDQIIENFSDLSSEQRAQLRFLAYGRPSLIARLAHDTEHLAATSTIVRDARTILSAPRRYDRLVVALGYTNRAKALELLDMCISLSRFSLRSAASRETIARLERLVDAHDAIRRNYNPRLQLLSLTLG